MLRKQAAWWMGAALLAGSMWTLWRSERPGTVAAAPAPANAEKMIVGAGRVEPASEEIKIGSELDGRLRSVPVREGDLVKRGQIVAVLENGDYAARITLAQSNLSQAQAFVAQSEASLERLLNGARRQERREAAATVTEAEAVLANAASERRRRVSLLERGAISRTEFESADREYLVAEARLAAVKERRALVDDDSRPEDIARARGVVTEAKARVEEMRARLNEAQAVFAKTEIRSPIDGVVLRKKLKAGESVSKDANNPIVTLGDLGRLRVRVDVDENDVSQLVLGQAAWVTAKAYGGRKFTGRVVEIGQALGRKNIRTDEPTERVDTKILETLVELDAGQSLPVGLRVDAYLEAKGVR